MQETSIHILEKIMKSKDVVIGMAVIPHDKTAGYFNYSGWLNSEELTIPPVLLVEKWDKFDRCWELTSLPLQDSERGGMFHAKDFEPCTTPQRLVRLGGGTKIMQYIENGKALYRFIDFLGLTNCSWDSIGMSSRDRAAYTLTVSLKNQILQFETVMDSTIYIRGMSYTACHIDFGNLIEEIE